MCVCSAPIRQLSNQPLREVSDGRVCATVCGEEEEEEEGREVEGDRGSGSGEGGGGAGGG